MKTRALRSDGQLEACSPVHKVEALSAHCTVARATRLICALRCPCVCVAGGGGKALLPWHAKARCEHAGTPWHFPH